MYKKACFSVEMKGTLDSYNRVFITEQNQERPPRLLYPVPRLSADAKVLAFSEEVLALLGIQ
jgi:hypothetical protein